MKTIKTSWEDITPQKAQNYLARNVTNRPVRERTVDNYANDMRAGRWMQTHQGIAFNDRGDLIDGQHRLRAIIKSDCTVKMMITRGLPTSVGKASTMDAVDTGAVRNLANQLQLQHGYKNANVIAAAATAISNICFAKVQPPKMSVNQILQVLEIYGRHIEDVRLILDQNGDRRLRRSPFIAAIAFARAVAPHDVDRFLKAVITGANLAEKSPALQLRNYLFRPEASDLIVGDRSERRAFVHLVLNSVFQFSEGITADDVSTKPNGFIAFGAKQADSVRKVAKIFGLEPVALDLAAYKKQRTEKQAIRASIAEAPKTTVDAKSFKLDHRCVQPDRRGAGADCDRRPSRGHGNSEHGSQRQRYPETGRRRSGRYRQGRHAGNTRNDLMKVPFHILSPGKGPVPARTPAAVVR